MCLGAGARAANKAARRQYEYQMKVRKRKHMNKLDVYKTQINTYKENLDEIQLGLGRTYAAAQTRLNRVKDAAWQRNQKFAIESLQNSAYGRAMAQGKTGRSIKRMGVMEAARIGRYYAQTNAALTDANEDFMLGVKRARQKAISAQNREFANVWLQPQADVTPSRPILQNVGQAMFMDALGIAQTGASLYTGFK